MLFYGLLVSYFVSAFTHGACVWVHVRAAGIAGLETKRMLVVSSSLLALRPMIVLVFALWLPFLEHTHHIVQAIIVAECFAALGMGLWAAWFLRRSTEEVTDGRSR